MLRKPKIGIVRLEFSINECLIAPTSVLVRVVDLIIATNGFQGAPIMFSPTIRACSPKCCFNIAKQSLSNCVDMLDVDGQCTKVISSV